MLTCFGCTSRGMAMNNAAYVLLRIQQEQSLKDEDKKWLKDAISICEEIELGRKFFKKNSQISSKKELDAVRAFKPNDKTSILTMAKMKSVKPLLDLLKKVKQERRISERELKKALNATDKLSDAYSGFAFYKLHGMEVAERELRGV